MKKTTPLPVKLIRGTILNSPSRLERLARASGWQKRAAKKLSPIDFVHGLLSAATNGDCSYREMAYQVGMHLNETDDGGCDTISKPGLWERMGTESVNFLELLLGELMRETMISGCNHSQVPSITGIRRILVEDSTALALDPSLATQCPANGNQHGEGAALRLQAVFDLLSGRVERLALGPFRRNDQAAASDIVDNLRPGDLLVRDLGYFALAAFASITRQGAHFLSRYLTGCAVSFPAENNGKAERLNLVNYLEKHASKVGDIVDIDVVLGTGQKGTPRPAVRLVARRVPEAVKEKRLRRLNAQGKRRGQQPSKTNRQLQSWEIYVTSLSRKQATAEKILQLYPLRWRIEVIFKACKSHTALSAIAAHRSNEYHVQTLLNAWLCVLVLAARTGAFALALPEKADKSDQRLQPNFLSLLKVVPKVFAILGSLLEACASPGQLLRRWACQMAYHDRYERRSGRRNMAESLAAVLELHSPELECEAPAWLP